MFLVTVYNDPRRMAEDLKCYAGLSNFPSLILLHIIEIT